MSDAIVEELPVCESRQGVVERLVDQLAFELATTSYVVRRHHDPAHFVVVRQVAPDALDGEPLAVGASQIDVVRDGPAAKITDECDQRIDLFRPQQLREVCADEVVGIDLENRAGRRCREPDRQVMFQHDDHIGRVLHEPPEPAFAFALEEVFGQRDALEGEGDLGSKCLEGLLNRLLRRRPRPDPQPSAALALDLEREDQEPFALLQTACANLGRPDKRSDASRLECNSDRFRNVIDAATHEAVAVGSRRRDDSHPVGAAERERRASRVQGSCFADRECGFDGDPVDALPGPRRDEVGGRSAQPCLATLGLVMPCDNAGKARDHQCEQRRRCDDHQEDVDVGPAYRLCEHQPWSHECHERQHHEPALRELLLVDLEALCDFRHRRMQRRQAPTDVRGHPDEIDLAAVDVPPLDRSEEVDAICDELQDQRRREEIEREHARARTDHQSQRDRR